MKATGALGVRVLFVVTFLLTAGAAHAQEATLDSWGKATSEKLAGFLPELPPSLTVNLPWQRGRKEPSMGYGIGGGTAPLYLPVGAVRSGWFDEPALVQQVEAAEKEVEAETRLLFQQFEALKPRLQELTKKYQECMQDRTRKVQELINQRKFQEIEKVPKCPEPKDPEEQKLRAKQKELDRRVPDLRARARWLEVAIDAHEIPEAWSDTKAKPVGTLKGYPLYRTVRSDPSTHATPEYVTLEVYLGPQGFRNPPLPSGQRMKWGEVKCIRVRVRLRSRPETVKGDEAVAQQMLEKVDYAGLAKLLQP